jgi:hypothetical protein
MRVLPVVRKRPLTINIKATHRLREDRYETFPGPPWRIDPNVGVR